MPTGISTTIDLDGTTAHVAGEDAAALAAVLLEHADDPSEVRTTSASTAGVVFTVDVELARKAGLVDEAARPDGEPPRSGSGATKAAWSDYARSLGLEPAEGAKLTELQQLVDDHRAAEADAKAKADADAAGDGGSTGGDAGTSGAATQV